MNEAQMVARVTSLLYSRTVVSRNTLEQRDWYSLVLDDYGLETNQANALIKAFAGIGASRLFWCLTSELLEPADTTTIHSLPFDITLLDSPMLDRESSFFYYNRIIFDENVTAVALLPMSLHAMYAGPKKFIETMSFSPWAEGTQRVRFFGNVFDDPDLKNHYKEELANKQPFSPYEMFSEATVSDSTVQALHKLVIGDRINRQYIRSKNWGLGIAYSYMGLASVAIATAFLKVGARHILLSRADQLDRAVSLEWAMPAIHDGVDFGAWLDQHVYPPRGDTIHPCLVYADNLAACLLVVDDRTLVFAGPAIFVEHATSSDLSQASDGIATELKTSGILDQVLADFPDAQ